MFWSELCSAGKVKKKETRGSEISFFSNNRFFPVRFFIMHAQQSSKEFQVVVLLKLSHLLAAA